MPLADNVEQCRQTVNRLGVVRPTVVAPITLDLEGDKNEAPEVQVKLDVTPNLIEPGGEAAVFFEDRGHPLAMKDRSDAPDLHLRRGVPARNPRRRAIPIS